MVVLLESARAVLQRHGHEAETFDRGSLLTVEELFARGNLAKYVACENAVQIMQLVMEVAGGVGYHRRFPIERIYRDVRAGAIMPDNSPVARTMLAFDALGLSRGEVFEADEGVAQVERLREEARDAAGAR